MNSYYVRYHAPRKSTEVVTGITATNSDVDTLDNYLTKITAILKDREIDFDADLEMNVDPRGINTDPGTPLYILIGADIDERLTVRLYNTTNVPMDVFTAILVTLTYGY